MMIDGDTLDGEEEGRKRMLMKKERKIGERGRKQAICTRDVFSSFIVQCDR